MKIALHDHLRNDGENLLFGLFEGNVVVQLFKSRFCLPVWVLIDGCSYRAVFYRLYVNSWGKEKPIERKKQVVKNETERSEVEFSLPAFARWVIEICTEYENGSV